MPTQAEVDAAMAATCDLRIVEGHTDEEGMRLAFIRTALEAAEKARRLADGLE